MIDLRDIKGRFIKGHLNLNKGKGGRPHCPCGKLISSYSGKMCKVCFLEKMHNKPLRDKGLMDNENYYRDYNKRYRHEHGISKKYNFQLGISHTREYKKLQCQKYKALKKNGGELLIKTIQVVYEDNIKKYGTLTCYLCLKPILFGKDHLEHRIPLSRGGNNEYNNLAIACQGCNCKKHAKTEIEYRKEILIK